MGFFLGVAWLGDERVVDFRGTRMAFFSGFILVVHCKIPRSIAIASASATLLCYDGGGGGTRLEL